MQFNKTQNMFLFFFQSQSMIGSTITPLEALDDLMEDEFERFVFFLIHIKGVANIPKRKLYQKSRVEVAENMIEAYGNEIALQVTIDILKKMKESQLAIKLEKQIQQKQKESDPIAVPVRKQRLANESRETCQPASVKKGKNGLSFTV